MRTRLSDKEGKAFAKSVRDYKAQGHSLKEVANHFGKSRGHIWAILANDIWKDPAYSPPITPRPDLIERNKKIKLFYKLGLSQTAIARHFGIRQPNVSLVVRSEEPYLKGVTVDAILFDKDGRQEEVTIFSVCFEGTYVIVGNRSESEMIQTESIIGRVKFQMKEAA